AFGADPDIAIPTLPDVAGVLRDIVFTTYAEPAGLDHGEIVQDHPDFSADVPRQRGTITQVFGAAPAGIVLGCDPRGIQLPVAAAFAALKLVEHVRLVPEVRVGCELVLQLVRQLVEECGRRHVGSAVGAAIGDPEQAQLGRIDHRGRTPLGHG